MQSPSGTDSCANSNVGALRTSRTSSRPRFLQVTQMVDARCGPLDTDPSHNSLHSRMKPVLSIESLEVRIDGTRGDTETIGYFLI